MTGNPSDEISIHAHVCAALDPHMLKGVGTTPSFSEGDASRLEWDGAVIVMIGTYFAYTAAFGVSRKE